MQVKSRVSDRLSAPRKFGMGNFHRSSGCLILKVPVMLLPEQPSRPLVYTGGAMAPGLTCIAAPLVFACIIELLLRRS